MVRYRTYNFLWIKCESNSTTLSFQTANTCPVDRITFAFIHQRRCPGGDIQKKVTICSVLKEAWCILICYDIMWKHVPVGGWTVCAAADQSEDTEKGCWWWRWRGGGKQCCYLWGMWTQRPQTPAASVYTLWFRVRHDYTLRFLCCFGLFCHDSAFK